MKTPFARRSIAKASLLAIGFALMLSVLPSPRVRSDDTRLIPLADTRVEFRQDVLPILLKHCSDCHGTTKQKGGLRLDSLPALWKGGASGEVVLPGQSAESPLIHHVSALEDTPRMPPKGDLLTPVQIEVLRKWIDQETKETQAASLAAADTLPSLWSMSPLERAEVPQVAPEFTGWNRNPIDAFVLKKLVEHQLRPAPEADRRTLIRRLSVDLWGLPPTPDEVDEFLKDTSENAYPKLVDRLLASSKYGERWARHWLDVAHYADSHGQDQDRFRPNAWPYRDYVIKSLNADKPYSRFVKEQVAGDFLYPDDTDALIATGFLAAGPFDESSLVSIREDSIDRLIGQYLDRDDIVTSTMSTFAGMTVGCARCHDHKFDPISQEDYYSLQAVFAGIAKAERAYDIDPALAKRRTDLSALLTRVKSLVGKPDPELLSLSLQAEAEAFWITWHTGEDHWIVPEPRTWEAKLGTILKPLLDRSILAVGNLPEHDTYTVTIATNAEGSTGLRLDLLPDETLPMRGPGRAANGNLHLSELRVSAAPKDQPEKSVRIKLVSAQADFDQESWGVSQAIDGNPATAWGIHPASGQAHRAIFAFDSPASYPEGTVFTIELDQLHGRGHLIGRFRLALTSQATPFVLEKPLNGPLAESLTVPADQRTTAHKAELARVLWQARLEREISALPPQAKVFCGTNLFTPDGSFKPVEKPRSVHILARGEVTKPGKSATPGSILAVTKLTGRFATNSEDHEGARRAALANWLTDPANPLTWRVIVNRVWHYHFGRGIVNTPNDFGKMGGTPSHPELLDWLALEFRDSGGSLKTLHRQIVTSSVYRQSSRDNPDSASRDIDNRLYWRMNRTRLDAESVRDAVLLVSGQLNDSRFGPPVRHFLVKPGVHVTPEPDYVKFDVDSTEARRRSIYRYIFRTRPDPWLEALDCPDASQSAPVRVASASPLQALALWNNKFMLKHADHLATLAIKTSNDPDEQLDFLARRVFSRMPTGEEQHAWSTYGRKHGLANLCRVLLNSSEFLFVD